MTRLSSAWPSRYTCGQQIMACMIPMMSEDDVSKPPSMRMPPVKRSWAGGNAFYPCWSSTQFTNEPMFLPFAPRASTLPRMSLYSVQRVHAGVDGFCTRDVVAEPAFWKPTKVGVCVHRWRGAGLYNLRSRLHHRVYAIDVRCLYMWGRISKTMMVQRIRRIASVWRCR